MSGTKNITIIGVYTALLIGGQLVLSAVSGIEVVTILLLSFSFYFGIKKSLIVVVAFSLLRCFLFGFFINVIILYFVYYSLFVLIFGALGNLFKQHVNWQRHLLIIMLSVFMTVAFTLLDDIITPSFYQFDKTETIAYAGASLYAVIPQSINSILMVSIFFRPLLKIFKLLKL